MAALEVVVALEVAVVLGEVAAGLAVVAVQTVGGVNAAAVAFALVVLRRYLRHRLPFRCRCHLPRWLHT